jgi:hypothetical protein
MLTAFYHPGYAAPIGAHVMPIRKFGLVAEGLRDAPDVQLVAPTPVSEADLRRVHTAGYIETIKTGEPRALAEGQKFPWSPELFPAVCLTGGGCLAAARQALRDGSRRRSSAGFIHACADHGEGFCTFNGLVVALEALRTAGEIQTAAGARHGSALRQWHGAARQLHARGFFAVSIYGNDYWDNICYREVTPLASRWTARIIAPSRYPPAVISRPFRRPWTPRYRSSPQTARCAPLPSWSRPVF